jgi:UPF0755 protein
MKLRTIRNYIPQITIFFVFVFCFGYYIWYSPPTTFPVGKTFVIKEDETLKSISNRLEQEGYIHSALLFRTMVSFLGKDRHVQLGGFTFDRPYKLQELVDKLVLSKPDTPLIKVTIPEGSTVEEVGKLVHKEIPSISENVFIELAKQKGVAGQLFPSTYYLLPSTSEVRCIDIMTQTFAKNYQAQFEDKEAPRELLSLTQILSLAAILEGEAKTEEDMQIVAGILLKRLKTGMLLQVDVAPITYKLKGLPEVPINNPGLIAIHAVFNPVETKYLFYLTGTNGEMHYAKTFEEHKINIKKYLK